MKKGITFAIVGLMGTALLAGCGSASPETTTQTAQTTQAPETKEKVNYVLPEGLGAMAVSDVSQVKVNINDRNIDYDVPEEADAQEVEDSRTFSVDAYIFNQPDLDSSVIGQAEEGDKVELLGELEDGVWYKISFNGRTAYCLVDETQWEEGEN